MGLVEMAHSAGLPYDRLAWTSTWYLREETLKAAVAALVNFQYRQPLAQHWGGGTLSSSDGQRFPVRGKVRNASALPRYFGYGEGITFYTWSSDQFSQYGTKVISSTVRDATYVLDEILNNETDLTILEHTTDTAGYTDLVFCSLRLIGDAVFPALARSSETGSSTSSKRMPRSIRGSMHGSSAALTSPDCWSDGTISRVWQARSNVATSRLRSSSVGCKPTRVRAN